MKRGEGVKELIYVSNNIASPWSYWDLVFSWISASSFALCPLDNSQRWIFTKSLFAREIWWAPYSAILEVPTPQAWSLICPRIWWREKSPILLPNSKFLEQWIILDPSWLMTLEMLSPCSLRYLLSWLRCTAQTTWGWPTLTRKMELSFSFFFLLKQTGCVSTYYINVM